MTASGRLYRMMFLLVLGLILAVPSHGQTAEEYRKQAVELSRAKSWDEAIANYRKALELEPNDATMHYDTFARRRENEGIAKVPAAPITARMAISFHARS